jgi:hypothetical protein
VMNSAASVDCGIIVASTDIVILWPCTRLQSQQYAQSIPSLIGPQR